MTLEWRHEHYAGELIFWSAPIFDIEKLIAEADDYVGRERPDLTARGKSTARNRLVRQTLEDMFSASEAGQAAAARPSYKRAMAVFRYKPMKVSYGVMFDFAEKNDATYFKLKYVNV